jgi:hypothetical protein
MPEIIDIGPPRPSDTYLEYILSMQAAYEFDSILVWEDMEGIGYSDFNRYIAFYNAFYDQFRPMYPNVKLYGPNIDVTWTDSLDSDHEQMLLDFMDQANGFDGLSFRSDLSASDWADLITYVKENIWDGALAVTLKGTPSDPAPIHSALASTDVVFWPASQQEGFTYESVGSYWKLEGQLTLNNQATNFRIRTDILTNPLRGLNRTIQIFEDSLDGDVVYSQQLPNVNTTLMLGSLGVADETHTYYYRISGMPAATGAGVLKVTFLADNIVAKSVQDTITVVA